MERDKIVTTLFHIFCWMLVFLPAIFIPQHVQLDFLLFGLRLCFPLLMCVVFYVNYFWLVPQYFIERRYNCYVIANVLMMLVASFLLQQSMDLIHEIEFDYGWRPHHHDDRTLSLLLLFFITRNLFPFALSASVATLLRLALKWHKAEKARKEMEMQKTEAELINLRNQINPHFLLNTLNNIYALIAFDVDKAQSAVLSLSSLLRQMLYDTQQNIVSINKEVDFISNYIKLMRLRLSDSVKVDVDINICTDKEVFIAPFIFISLVENAFKHGISYTNPSFISVRIFTDGKIVECEIKNSNYPKTNLDRSGHGIGLSQIGRILDLAYHDNYEWTRGTDEKKEIYYSKIVIYDTELRNN